MIIVSDGHLSDLEGETDSQYPLLDLFQPHEGAKELKQSRQTYLLRGLVEHNAQWDKDETNEQEGQYHRYWCKNWLAGP